MCIRDSCQTSRRSVQVRSSSRRRCHQQLYFPRRGGDNAITEGRTHCVSHACRVPHHLGGCQCVASLVRGANHLEGPAVEVLAVSGAELEAKD
eukprot:15310250-Alexandrium_andersonii.AAC.1